MNAPAQTHAEAARRAEAFSILESIEELIWAATKRNETIPQTRLYYEKIVAGIDPDTPKPLYAEATWGDETPPRRKVGPDPRARGGTGVVVKLEEEVEQRQDAGGGVGDVDVDDDIDDDEGGGVQIKAEDAPELEMERGRQGDASPGLRRREDMAAGDKRKRGRKGGQSVQLPEL